MLLAAEAVPSGNQPRIVEKAKALPHGSANQEKEMSKHQPGPWEFSAGADYGDEGFYADVTALDGDLIIARVNNLIPSGSANGELMASAPELLEAAIAAASALAKFVSRHDIEFPALEKLRTAIAKATA